MENITIKKADTKSLKHRKEILIDGYFYHISDAAIEMHPGGTEMEYYTNGVDATNAIQQFHYRLMKRTKTAMRCMQRRPASDSEIGLDAEVPKKNRALTDDFTKLHLELEKEGIFETSYIHCFWRTMEITLLFAFAVTLLQWQNYVAKFIGSVIFGLAGLRAAYLTHELGHLSHSGSPKLDSILQSAISGLLCGLSASRWKEQHIRHHAMPQREHYDVDLDTMPLTAFNEKVVKNSKVGKTFLIRNQVYLFLLIDFLLVGIIRQMYQDPKFMFKNAKELEIAASIVYWLAVWNWIGFWPWLLSMWIASAFLVGNFSLSHTHLPATTEPTHTEQILGTHWVKDALLHTSDVEHTDWCSWIMGYQNYQIEHHLFPSIPHFRLHLITYRVKALAEKHNLPYIIHSYPEACRKTLNNLSNVAK